MKVSSSLIQFYRVFSHEYDNIIRSKLFRVLTFIILFVIVLMLTVPSMTAKKSAASRSTVLKPLLIVDDTGMFTQADFSSETGYTITFQRGTTTVDQMKEQIIAGIYDDAMFISQTSQEKIEISFVTKSVIDSLPQNLKTLISAANIKNIMTKYNIPSSAISQALTAPDLNVIATSSNNLANGLVPSYVFIMLLFYSIIVYGVMVASGVAQEKSSRAMELLITSARTHNLILGKIIGIGLAGLTQLAIWMAGLFVLYHLNIAYWKENAIISGLLGVNASNLALMLLFFLLGFFMYAALYGTVGSIVSRSEEIQMFQLPITFLLIIGLFCTTIGMVTSGSLLTVLSFIPIYIPISMFARMSTTDVPYWQFILSVTISAVTVVVFAGAAVKIYRVGVLMYGKTPSIKEVYRALRDDKRNKSL